MSSTNNNNQDGSLNSNSNQQRESRVQDSQNNNNQQQQRGGYNRNYNNNNRGGYNNNNNNQQGGGGNYRGGRGGRGRYNNNSQDGGESNQEGGDQGENQQQQGNYRGGRGRGNNRGGHYNNNRGGGGYHNNNQGAEGATTSTEGGAEGEQQGSYQPRNNYRGGRGRGNNNYHNNNQEQGTEGDAAAEQGGASSYHNNNSYRGGRGGNRGGRGGNRGGFNRPGDDDDGEYNEYSRPPRDLAAKQHQTAGNGQQINRRPPRTASEEKAIEDLFVRRHRQTGEGINFDRYAEIPVQISPEDIEGVKSFSGLSLHPLLAANIQRCGYENPTPVQKFGIPVTFANKDIMACAQTGSGKTAAFLLPVVNHILNAGISHARGRLALPYAAIMAPTRELALQIYDEARKFSFKTDVRPTVVYGGIDFNIQAAELLAGCDLIIATPGRLKDMFDRKRVAFDRIKYLVLDEADRMLDLGFEDEIRHIVDNMPGSEDRQTMLYSATFPKPIQMLARQFLKFDFYLLKVGRVGSTTKNIVQRVKSVSPAQKTNQLLNIINESSQTDLILVFVATKAQAEDLRYALNREELPATSIHGDRKQWEREEALAQFKSGETPIMIATDVASRGLDIPNVSHVIQYDLPNTLEDYVHRIGRTGRAGNQGLATSFFCDANRGLAPELFNYLKDHEQEVPEWLEEATTERFIEKRAIRGGARRGGGGGMGGGGGRGAAAGGAPSRDGNKSWGARAGQDDGEDFFNKPAGGGRAKAGGFDDGGF